MKPAGYLALVLHAHLPFVRHPEYEHFLEEDWLYEAITETYIPLIEAFDRLLADGIPFRITMTLSPPLVAMLGDGLLQERYSRHLGKLRELAALECRRNRDEPHMRYLAGFYRSRFEAAEEVFERRYRRNLLDAFRKFQDAGVLEIITCGATHAFLPNYPMQPEVVRAQIGIAARHYREVFGRRPLGIWLPECGYFPGVDEFLAEEGIRFFFTDAHGILHARPRPRYGTLAPVFCPYSGVAAFGRDLESSRQVWSAREGYPGDSDYREFYRDIGFDLPQEIIAPYVQPDGARKNTGIKYHRVTGPAVPLHAKELYDPEQARRKADAHAGNFMFNRERQIEHARTVTHGPPIIVAPYDAELLGHWWYEGPLWLELLIRKSAYDQRVFSLTTPADYLREHDTHQVCAPSFSSWGDGGYSAYWLDGVNDWIYRHLHVMGFQMVEVAGRHAAPDPLQTRVLNQAGRELVLAQSSDWAFIMKTGTTVPYAVNRTRRHASRFFKLMSQLRSSRIDEPWLAGVELQDNIFPGMDFRQFRSLERDPDAPG